MPMNFCGWMKMQRTVALLLPLLILSSAAKNDFFMANAYRRCLTEGANQSHLVLEELRQIPCLACGSISTIPTIEHSEDTLSVALFVESQDEHYYPQAIASSLLHHGHRVTVLISPEFPQTENEIWARILGFVPCEQQALAHSLLSVQTVQLRRYMPDCPYYGEIMCHVPAQLWVEALQSAFLSIGELDVVLLEATSLAVLLVTERLKIPSITMANDVTQLREMLGSNFRPRKIRWTPIGLKRWFEPMLFNRWRNFVTTPEFVTLNMLRRKLGMRPLRTVADVWKAPASVIMTTLPAVASSSGQEANLNLQSFAAPILPPCLPCWSTSELVTNDWPVVIVTTHGQRTSLADARYILKGLAMALASARKLRDQCDWEEGEPGDCWNGDLDFSVVWLPTEGATPALLPDFVTIAKGSLLDNLARYKHTLAIVTLCIDDSLWIAGLGPRILCWDDSSSTRDMGLRLLQLLRKPAVKPLEQTRGDCLRHIVSLVERVVDVKRKYGPGWITAADMGRDLRVGLQLREESTSENNSGLFVFAAWCILVSAVFYVIHEKTFPTHTSRLRRYRHHQRMTFTDIMDEIVFRLPELEQICGLWTVWSAEKLSCMQESVPVPAPRERVDSKDGNHSTHSVRKRRPAKGKRH